jgi:hypothetical protein
VYAGGETIQPTLGYVLTTAAAKSRDAEGKNILFYAFSARRVLGEGDG